MYAIFGYFNFSKSGGVVVVIAFVVFDGSVVVVVLVVVVVVAVVGSPSSRPSSPSPYSVSRIVTTLIGIDIIIGCSNSTSPYRSSPAGIDIIRERCYCCWAMIHYFHRRRMVIVWDDCFTTKFHSCMTIVTNVTSIVTSTNIATVAIPSLMRDWLSIAIIVRSIIVVVVG